MRRTLVKIYIIAIACGVGYYLLTQVIGLSVPCLIYETTGFMCPGCGLTHMFLALLHFDIAGAFGHNPFMLILISIWNLIALLLFIGKPRWLKSERVLLGALYLSLAAALIFTVCRNL